MTEHPLSTTLAVSADAAATRAARALVRDLCASATVDPEAVETAALLVTELVTNAIEHGGGEAVIAAALDHAGDSEAGERRLRVSVLDDNPALPTARPPAIDTERGRGLLLVEALASQWGAEMRGRGKRVWFELGLAPVSQA